MRDLNPKGYKITEENNKTYVNGEEKSLKEIFILLSLRPYWAKSDFKYEEYRGLILHKTTISKIIEFDDQAYKDVLKACVKDGRPLYYVKIRAVDGVLYADSDANLDSMSLPIHESWVTGRPSNKEWRPPDLCYEMDREKPLSKMIGCAIGNDGMKCANCGKIMSSMSGYTLHAKTCKAKPISTDGTVYACHICGKKTISSYGLTNHIKSAHQIQIKEDV